MKKIFPKTSSATHAFSLVELLVVTGILASLLVLVVPSISGLGGAGRARQALVEISGALERAREYAIAKNTYTWVAFQNPEGTGSEPLIMGTIASMDGSRGGVSLSGGATHPVSSNGAGPLSLVDRLKTLDQCVIRQNLPAGTSLASNLPSTSSSPSYLTGPQFSVIGPGGDPVTFSHSVMFTPSGEARVSEALPEAVQLAVYPTRGEIPNPITDDAGASVIRILGLTGRVNVYRP